MKALTHDQADEWAEACKRITGRSLIEWAAEWRERREQAVSDGRLNPARYLTFYERESTIRHFDFSESDFTSARVPAHKVSLTRSEKAGQPPVQYVNRCRITPDAVAAVRHTTASTTQT